MYPLSIPQTPSPPSSPESVVIIGNEPRVSGAFLRRSCSDDDNGWVTWASSPPRPIPALHGPLSLPYARCPSGAEGTVIEGDDLSHKIWGLGTGDTQNNAHTSGKAEIQNQEPKTFAMHTKIPCHDTRQLAFQHPRLSDDVIDLSTIPSAAYSGYQTAPATFERYLASSRISHPCFQPGLGHRGEHSNSNDSKITTGVLFSQRVANLCTKRYYYDSADIVENSRSGLDLSKPTTDKATSQFVGSTQRRLNRAAPAFIPSMGWSSNESHIMQKENDPSTLNHQFMRRVELSQQCAIELPTPPSTSSPRWSPVFSHPIDIELSRGACGDPKIYSPQPDLDDYSNKLMSMIQQIKQQDLMNSSKRHSLDVARQTREPLVQKGLVASTANKYHQERFQEDPGRTNVSQPPLDIRRNLSQQNPRSIPLTRLIQRRLSSVPEETNGPTQVQTIRPRVSLEPLIYISATEQLTRGTVTSTAPSVQSSTETVDVQPEEQNPNAIVKLPHRRVGLRAARTLSGPSSKARAGGVSKKEKEEIINGENDKPNSEITPEKGRAGQMKKSKVNEDNKHKHCTQ
uniref:Uncharacterized protein n=1 Tax=Psilocybe cubensis TaxID=181762 RepID=A0A8H8CP69_PSICU